MNKVSGWLRMVLGALVAPWIYVFVWTMPMFEQSDFHRWVMLNMFLAYVAFMALAWISHVVLALLRATKIWSYVFVMFAVAVSVDLLLSLGSLSWYTSFSLGKTQLVENDLITQAGYMLQFKEALVHGVVSATAMGLFWFLAIFKPKSRAQIA